MFESLLFRLLFLLLMTTAIVISEDDEENHLEETQLKANITCACTEDEECDGTSETCKISHPYHMCYESWSLRASDGTIQHTAG